MSYQLTFSNKCTSLYNTFSQQFAHVAATKIAFMQNLKKRRKHTSVLSGWYFNRRAHARKDLRCGRPLFMIDDNTFLLDEQDIINHRWYAFDYGLMMISRQPRTSHSQLFQWNGVPQKGVAPVIRLQAGYRPKWPHVYLRWTTIRLVFDLIQSNFDCRICRLCSRLWTKPAEAV